MNCTSIFNNVNIFSWQTYERSHTCYIFIAFCAFFQCGLLQGKKKKSGFKTKLQFSALQLKMALSEFFCILIIICHSGVILDCS